MWLSLLLAACGYNQAYDGHTPYYGISEGSQVELRQALTLLPGRARAFLQRGALVSGRLDQYHPHCNFEVRTLSDEARSIAPDSFVVVRLQLGFTEVVSLEPVRLAMLNTSAWYPADGPLISRYVHLYLASKRQPDVLRLTCHGAFDFMPEAQWPTVEEMQEALGGIAELQQMPLPGIIR
jgi:hypothetical protein